jgi:hexulose-6-phosphate isomerase
MMSVTSWPPYGHRIGSVHIKDRILGGGTVSLGAGNADLSVLFSGLAALPYRGDYVLQVARGQEGREVEWAQQNRAFVVQKLEQAKSTAAGNTQ